MKIEIKVPVMGESISEATLGRFLAPSGSYVISGQEIVELETDKVNQVLYASASGVISFAVAESDVVKIGQTLGFIDADAAKPAEASIKKEEKKVQTVSAPPSAASAPSVRVQDGVRKTADDFLQGLQKTEKPSVIPVSSVQEGSLVSRKKLSGLRKTIASRLVEVKNKTAMLTTFNEIDMSSVMEIRAKEQELFVKRYGVKLGFMSFFIKATVSALKAYPVINSFLDGDEIVTFATYDMGVAVSTEKGLFVPVVRKCDELSFGAIEETIAKHAKKAREGGISIEDLQGGSFTITNGGVFGSLLSTPILNPPQSAILGMHSIVKRPIALNDQVVIRPMMYVALSYDHRLIDGREAVLFLAHIKANLEDPAKLLLDL
ncbi:MAG: dihydrolipoyllysine-residue succinyltransferase [Rhabdochlamydiaceae bacterium]|nr:dihydrolipoyllysine-residue succinyltransferase [Rhabdochlamydiaceae bacterium]